MNLLKKSLSEYQAVQVFLQGLMQSSMEAWPLVTNRIHGIWPDVELGDDRSKNFDDFYIATLFMNLQALDNIFDPEKAPRIHGLVCDVLSDNGRNVSAVEELAEYEQQWHEATHADPIENPLDRVAVRLLVHWAQTTSTDIPKDSDPLLILTVQGLLVIPGPKWKAINQEFKLVA